MVSRAFDVGNRIRVQLIHTDVERGFIDFRKVGQSRIVEGKSSVALPGKSQQRHEAWLKTGKTGWAVSIVSKGGTALAIAAVPS